MGYAAVHNTDPALGLYYVNKNAAGHSGKRPVRRQFIGFSPSLDAQMELLIPMLFKHFPFPND